MFVRMLCECAILFCLPKTKAHNTNSNSSGSTESNKFRVSMSCGFMLAIPYGDALHS
jgi:hypothetical protein